jgi:hypothetical protein
MEGAPVVDTVVPPSFGTPPDITVHRSERQNEALTDKNKGDGDDSELAKQPTRELLIISKGPIIHVMIT